MKIIFFEHEKRNFIIPSNHVYFIKPTNNEGFDDVPKISDHFPKVSEDFQNVVWWLNECSRTFPEILENSRRLPRKIRDVLT